MAELNVNVNFENIGKLVFENEISLRLNKEKNEDKKEVLKSLLEIFDKKD